MLPIIKECKLKTKSKKLLRLAIIFVAAFSISTPAVMFFSAGTVTLNLFVDGFWMLGLFQSFVFTIVASSINDMLNNPACNDEDWDNDMLNNPACNDEDWDNDMLNNPVYSWSMSNIHHSD